MQIYLKQEDKDIWVARCVKCDSILTVSSTSIGAVSNSEDKECDCKEKK